MAEITEIRAAYGEYSAGLSLPDTPEIWMLRIMDAFDLVKIALIYDVRFWTALVELLKSRPQPPSMGCCSVMKWFVKLWLWTSPCCKSVLMERWEQEWRDVYPGLDPKALCLLITHRWDYSLHPCVLKITSQSIGASCHTGNLLQGLHLSNYKGWVKSTIIKIWEVLCARFNHLSSNPLIRTV